MVEGFRVKDVFGYECELMSNTLITVEVSRLGDAFEYSCVARPADMYGNKAILMRGRKPGEVLKYADEVRQQIVFSSVGLPFDPTYFELLST